MYMIDMNLVNAHPSIVSTPALAHECSLASTAPNPLRSERGMVWDNKSIQMFKSLIEKQQCDNASFDNDSCSKSFIGKIHSVVPNPTNILSGGPLINIIMFNFTHKYNKLHFSYFS